MSAEIFRILSCSALSVSLCIVIVAVARWPVRKLAGPSVAYCLWLLIPGSVLAPLLPPIGHDIQLEAVRPIFRFAQADRLVPAATTAGTLELTLLAIWSLGFACAMLVVALQHRRLVRSLSTSSDPMVLGILRPRIVLPADFATRYGPEEQALILMHEQVHLRRRDSAMNALATLIWCTHWFNPLVHWAIRRYRLDQEISVDHAVVQGSLKRGTYGAMLLKAQLAGQQNFSPFVSSWSPHHPLKERLQMLKVTAPNNTRRNIGVTIVGALLVSVTQLLWGAQTTPTAALEDSSVSFAADRTSVLTDGVIMLSGHVKLQVDPAATLQFSSDSVGQGADGSTVLQGNVQLKFAQLIIKTSTANLQADTGTIEMDEAYVIRLE